MENIGFMLTIYTELHSYARCRQQYKNIFIRTLLEYFNAFGFCLFIPDMLCYVQYIHESKILLMIPSYYLLLCQCVHINLFQIFQ